MHVRARYIDVIDNFSVLGSKPCLRYVFVLLVRSRTLMLRLMFSKLLSFGFIYQACVYCRAYRCTRSGPSWAALSLATTSQALLFRRSSSRVRNCQLSGWLCLPLAVTYRRWFESEMQVCFQRLCKSSLRQSSWVWTCCRHRTEYRVLLRLKWFLCRRGPWSAPLQSGSLRQELHNQLHLHTVSVAPKCQLWQVGLSFLCVWQRLDKASLRHHLDLWMSTGIRSC